jgi:hypothetical protein
LLINLFIAVVLDAFNENQETFQRQEKFEAVMEWRNVWSWFDPDACKEVTAREFIEILKLTPRGDTKKQKAEAGFFEGSPFTELFYQEYAKKKIHTIRKTTTQRSSTTVGLQRASPDKQYQYQRPQQLQQERAHSDGVILELSHDIIEQKEASVEDTRLSNMSRTAQFLRGISTGEIFSEYQDNEQDENCCDDRATGMTDRNKESFQSMHSAKTQRKLN